MHHFTYRDGVLHAEDVSLKALADEVGTPFYCYSSATLERHYRVLDNLHFYYGRPWPVDIALWDLAGKITGQPVWRLCGSGFWSGCRSKNSSALPFSGLTQGPL